MSDVRPEKIIHEVPIRGLTPVTEGSHRRGDRKVKLADAIRERITEEKMAQIRIDLADKLIAVSVQVYLWKSPPEITNTRRKMDLDNLLKVLLDILKSGPGKLGLVKDDDFICQIHATKELVEKEEDEGYLIVMEEYEDEEMLQSLKELHSKNS